MSRLNQILIGLLVVQLAVAAVVFWPRPAAGQGGEPLFPGLEAGQVTGLTVEGAEEQSIHLAKVEGRWVLPDAGNYPVLEDKVTTLLQTLVGLKTGRLVTQTGTSHARLQVAADEFVRRVEIEAAGGARHILYLGSSPSYQATHVRVEGQDEVYLASGLSAEDVGAAANAWVDTAYFSVARDQVKALTLVNANGTFQFTRDGETWAMAGLEEGETLDQQALDLLLSRATSVTLLRPLGSEKKAEYGMDNPQAVVTIQADKSYNLLVGAQDPADSSYVLKSSESPFYVRVAEFVASDMVAKTRADFLAATPTLMPEAPEGTPTP